MKFEPPAKIDYSRYRALKLSASNGIMTVTLSNPGRKNAVTPRMQDELATLWDDLWAAFETSLAYEIYSMKMDDVGEATKAFVEKRKGDFTGN